MIIGRKGITSGKILGFILFFVVTGLFSFSLFNNDNVRSVYIFQEGNEDWMEVRSDIKLSVEDVTEAYKSQLGLSDSDELVLMRVDQDQVGQEHHRFQHFHKNIKVEGSQLLVHTRNDRVYLVNSTLVKGLMNPVILNINEDSAIKKAISQLPADKYMWESEWAERLIKKVSKDPTATNFPDPTLVWVSPKYSRIASEYTLAYDMTIHSIEPELKRRFFINAADGSTTLTINDLHEGSTPGVGESKYHGTVDIITDSLASDSYRLVDTVRGAGVYTFDAMRQTNMELAVDFLDDDNYWNNFNQFEDEVAVDAHWGAEMTFDYYLDILGREGLNGDTLPFIGFVHVDNDWTNATWNGMFARFGDGGGNNDPLTALDVVAHEYTHGLTDFTADLVYMDEPGALNESYSDIYGTAVEFFADPATAEWMIGEDFIATGGFRSMNDPKSLGDPDTYLGANWVTGAGDNGGVHTNSGVQNYWFYLLTVGGSGLNDNTEYYEVEGLGMDTAAVIAYQNLAYYLMVNSQYIDARMGGIQSARDLYGECSDAVSSVTNAWHAVGVGGLYARNDFEIIEITGPDNDQCGASADEILSISMRYNDCNTVLYEGTKVPLEFSVDNGELYLDTLILIDSLANGDTVYFSFSQPIVEFAEVGDHEINLAVTYPGDNVESNNSIRESFTRIYAQNVDMALAEVVSPNSGCFLGVEEFIYGVRFDGCDSIQAGETVEMHYRIDNGDWNTNASITLDSTLLRGEVVYFPLDETFDFTEKRNYLLDARIVYGPDTINFNDAINNIIVDHPDSLLFRVLMTFEGEGSTSQDSFFMHEGSKTDIQIKEGVGFKETKGLSIEGTDGLEQLDDDRIELPDFTNVWSINDDYRSQICFCADLTFTQTARLKFRINQRFSPIYQDLFGNDVNYAAAARLLINGQQFGGNYKPSNYENNPYLLQNLSLGNYVGAPIEICFETSALTSQENDPYGIGDMTFIDEIEIVADVFVNQEEIDFETEVKLYPNPAKETVFIFADQINLEKAQWQLYSIDGRMIDVPSQTINSGLQLGVDNLTSGTYYLSITTDEGFAIKKLVIQE